MGMPVVLDLADVSGLKQGDKILLRWNGEDVAALMSELGGYYVGGKVHGLKSPTFRYAAHTPAEVRESIPANKDVVAFQNRNPIHKAHFELLKCAQADVTDSIVLV